MPTKRIYESMSREQLVEALQQLDNDSTAHESARLIHELRTHQIELELQNRDLQEAQQQLEESRARFSDLYDFAPVGYCTVDLRGHITEANLTAATMVGFDRSHLIGLPLASLSAPKNARLIAMHLDRCWKERERSVAEVNLRAPHARMISVQLVSTPILGPERTVVGCRTTLTDVSALKRSEERLRSLASAGEALSSSLDEETTLSTISALLVPRLADICFIDLLAGKDHLRRRVASFADPSREGCVAKVRSLVPQVTGKGPHARALRLTAPVVIKSPDQNTLRELLGGGPDLDSVMAHCIPNAASIMLLPLLTRARRIGVLALIATHQEQRYDEIEDVELAHELARRAALAIDNAQLYRAARDAIRAREDVLAVVSHDLKNPLNSVMMNVEVLLQSGTTVSPSGERQLKAISRGVGRMDRMIGDLLDLARIESGHLPVELTAVEVGPLVTEAAELLRPLAERKSLHFTIENIEETLLVCCDRERILQVLSNLLGNAVKFTPEGGSISFGADREDGGVRFTVRDSGPGISPDRVPHLFDRYWQAEETAKKGLGLGLFIARGIVEAHASHISVFSKPGLGSTFYFSLPLASPKAERRQPVPTPATRPAEVPIGERPAPLILIVDDDEDAREVMRELLERTGYQVGEARNGVEALQYLNNAHPSLILLDLKMPIMDGWELHAELRRNPRLATIPVVVLSGGRGLEGEAAALGAQGFIEKPTRIEQLLEVVERHSGA